MYKVCASLRQNSLNQQSSNNQVFMTVYFDRVTNKPNMRLQKNCCVPHPRLMLSNLI